LVRLDLVDEDSRPQSYADLRQKASAAGIVLAESGEDYMVPLAARAAADSQFYRQVGQGTALVLSVLGAGFAYSRIRLRLRARNQVERVVLWGLVGASSIAVLTTVGIILSMTGETIRFFSEVNPLNFFFGT